MRLRTNSPFRFGLEIDGRGRALFAPADVAEIERLPEPALALADKQHNVALALEGEGGVFVHVVEQADAADGGRGQDAAPVGLIIE